MLNIKNKPTFAASYTQTPPRVCGGKYHKMTEKYDQSGLHEDILKSIRELGFVTPTPIQAKAIPYILEEDKDLLALAQTGTGKTAAFGLPILQQVDINNNSTQILILSPTRELCMQISDDLSNYSKFLDGVKITAVFGGANISTQIRELRKGVHIVVGTPGRTLDLIRRKVLKITDIKKLVLDEADEMLNMGFQEDLDAILENTPKDKRTFLFSATMPKGVMRIAERYMNDWEKIAVNAENSGSSNVKHRYYVTHARNRFEALKRIVDEQPNIYGLIFCRTRQEAKDLASSMIQNGYDADALHGDVPQAQRTIVMNRFKTRQLQLLVATDVAARGVDVNDLTHVINYNLPDDKEIYVHRSGRTGRAGKEGISVAIVHTRELRKIKDIERFAKISFEKAQIPDGIQICEKQLFSLVDKIEKTEVAEEQIAKFLPVVYKKLAWLSREELIKKMVSVEFNRFLEYYKDAKDLNVQTKDRGGEKKSRGGKFTTLSLNVGKKHGIDARVLIGMINEVTDSNTVPIGKIEINRRQTLFEVGTSHKNKVLKAFKDIAEEAADLEVKELSGGVEEYKEQKSKPKSGNNRRNKKRKPTSKDRYRSSKRKSTRRERRRKK